MPNKPNSRIDLLQGTLDLLILHTLRGGPMHGHSIGKEIKRSSSDVFHIETGSLYPALHRLEAKGWVSAAWEHSETGKRARFYRLTARGRKQLATEQSRWETAARAMTAVLSPGKQEAQ
jgi:PadR family transcriptional regulator, regulatory protein PadR